MLILAYAWILVQWIDGTTDFFMAGLATILLAVGVLLFIRGGPTRRKLGAKD